MTIDVEALRRLRSHAHVHSDRCFGRYVPCGEHHMHDDTCGSRERLCRTAEDRDLALLLAAYEQACAERDELDDGEGLLDKVRALVKRNDQLRALLAEAVKLCGVDGPGALRHRLERAAEIATAAGLKGDE